MRAEGRLRFLTISARTQKVVSSVAAVLLVGWLVLSGNLLVSQLEMLSERSSVTATWSRAQQTFQEAKARQRSAAARATALEERQRALENVAYDYFRLPGSGEDGPNASGPRASVPLKRTGDRLKDMNRRQEAFIRQFEMLANKRAAKAERAVASLGIDLNRLTEIPEGQGGPYQPVSAASADDDILRLADTISRLDRLERALLSLPSFTPAERGRLTSGFGLRRDPFNGRGAMHSGQDFGGAHQSPIRAAAPGRVVRAGWWGGYGRVVVIDHGGGIRTRYAHLAGLSVERGDKVRRGDLVGRMGSSGRSTGTHLHFEVRIDGKAVNPRPFLESPDHVLEIQAHAGRRLADDQDAG